MNLLIKGSKETTLNLLSGKLDDKTKKACFKSAVEIINLETSYYCNRKCDYCPVSESTRQTDQISMEIKLLRKIAIELAEIRYENRISLNGYNEPLLDKRLEQKIEIIRKNLPWVTLSINSNGDRLKRDRLISLSNAGLNYICVTLHPQPFKSDTKATLKKRIKKIIEKNVSITHTGFDLNDGYVDFQTGGLRLKVQWPNWRILGTDRAGTINNYGKAKLVRELPCIKPFREFTIFYDGTVQPCCESFYDKNTKLTKVANLNNDTIFEAYTSQNLSMFRQSIFGFGKKTGICKFCNSIDYSCKKEDKKERETLLRQAQKYKND